MNRKAQHLIFSATIMLFLFLLIITLFFDQIFLPRDANEHRYEAVKKEAVRLSDTLVLPGYPHDWQPGDVERAGLTTDGQLNRTKLDNLAQLASDDYNATKRLLGVRHDYAINISLPSGQRVIGRTPDDPRYHATQRRTLKDATTERTIHLTAHVYEASP